MLTLPVCRGTSGAAGPHVRAGPFTVRESIPDTPPKPRLLDRVRAAARVRHYSRRTEDADVAWITRAIPPRWAPLPLLAGGRWPGGGLHPAPSLEYRDVLEIDLPGLDGLVRATRPERLPVVLTREEGCESGSSVFPSEIRVIFQTRLRRPPVLALRRCSSWTTAR